MPSLLQCSCNRLPRKARPSRHEECRSQPHANFANVRGDLSDKSREDGSEAAKRETEEGGEDDSGGRRVG